MQLSRLMVGGIVSGGSAVVGDIKNLGQAIANGDGWGIAEHASLAVMDALNLAAAFQKSCFAAGTPILTPEGSRPIEQLRVGDWVLSTPEDDPEAPRVVHVFESYAPLLELRVCGGLIQTTAKHPFWVEGRGWTDPQQLLEGDRLRSHDGQLLAIEG